MSVMKIKQTVTHEGIIIPLNKIQKFKGKKVDIIISDSDTGTGRKESFKKKLSDLFEKYKDVRPFKNIDPLEWESEIRNEW